MRHALASFAPGRRPRWRTGVVLLTLLSLLASSLGASAAPAPAGLNPVAGQHHPGDASAPAVDIPIQTASPPNACSVLPPSIASTLNPASDTVVCTTADGRTVTKSATPTASDIAQFVKGFVVGVLDGLWQQVSGLWGLLLNLGSLGQLAQDLVHHPSATLKAIAKALGKQFDTVGHLRQELVCEPYEGAKTSGALLVTLAATLDGEGVANDVEQVLQATSKDLENVAQNTATDTLDLTVVNIGDEAKAVADEFATGKNVVVEISKDTSNIGFDELAKIRYELGLPAAGSAADKSTLAMTVVDGEKIFGINAHGQPVSGVNAISASHAEIDVLNQIKQEGIDVSGQDLTLYVDRAPCAACGQNGGIRSMVEQLGLKKLTVISPDGRIIITPR